MKRHRQKLADLISALSEIETTWMDEHSAAVVDAISRIPVKRRYTRQDIADLLKADFEVAFTTIRLVLGLAKDEYVIRLKGCLGGTGGIGVNRFRREPDAYLDAIESLGILT